MILAILDLDTSLHTQFSMPVHLRVTRFTMAQRTADGEIESITLINSSFHCPQDLLSLIVSAKSVSVGFSSISPT